MSPRLLRPYLHKPCDHCRGLRHLADRLANDFLVGLVLYTGVQTLPFGDRMRAMPVSALRKVG